jgi:hypothetical protein
MVKRILTRPKNKKKSVWKWKIKVCNWRWLSVGAFVPPWYTLEANLTEWRATSNPKHIRTSWIHYLIYNITYTFELSSLFQPISRGLFMYGSTQESEE